MKNTAFKKDLYRYYGEKGEDILHRIFRPAELEYVRLLRKWQGARSSVYKKVIELRLLMLSRKSHIQIPARTRIGEGFYIGHSGRVIIHPDAVIGKNVNIATGVTIGQENRGKRKGCPTIGDNVWIGTNAVVVGNITVGTDVMIAPLSLVNFDVPDHSIVIGSPAKIIHRENATESYIDYPV